MIKAGIIGSTGYAGAELVRLLLQHPQAEIVWYGSRSYADQKYAQVYRNFFELVDETCMNENLDALAEMMGVPEMNTIGGEVTATGSSAGMSDANLERLANAIVTAIDKSGMNQASIELDGRVLGRYMRDGMGVEFV